MNDNEPTIRELLLSQKHTQKTLDKLVDDFKPVQKHVYMVNGAIKLISVVVAIAGVIVSIMAAL